MADKIIAGNWKMNLTATDAMQLVKDLNIYNTPADVRVLVFPSSLYTGIASAFSKNVENVRENDTTEHQSDCHQSLAHVLLLNVVPPKPCPRY